MSALDKFLIFNKNSFYYILYFLKHNYLLLFVAVAIIYMFISEMKIKNENFVDDRRRIV